MKANLSDVNKYVLEDRNVLTYKDFPSPAEMKRQISLTDRAAEVVVEGRRGIESILDSSDGRLLAIVGPCSIHNINEAEEYASELAQIARRVKDKILVVMRTYFEKPRTGEGWQGLLNDPSLDGSNGMNGYALARDLLVRISELGLPCGTEFVEMDTPQYIGDAMAWACIGARTVESQPHRKMASGLSMPVGFKNGTDGNIQKAINGMIVASKPQSFLGLDNTGSRKMVYTKGNRYAHLILRGGDEPNYYPECINEALSMIRGARQKGFKFSEKLIVDASHGNSGRDYRKQPEVFLNVLKQRADGNGGIAGLMLESYIEEGSQKLDSLSNLKKGISITDGCIGLATTKRLLLEAYKVIT